MKETALLAALAALLWPTVALADTTSLVQTPVRVVPAGEAVTEDELLRRLTQVEVMAPDAKVVNLAAMGQSVPFEYEFGWECLVAVPHAYALSLKGKLASTSSCGDMGALYWFSSDHTNVPCSRAKKYFRSYERITREAFMSDVPDKSLPAWVAPPHRQHYEAFPVLPQLVGAGVRRSIMVLNKYTKEWDRDPVNFLPVSLLRWMQARIAETCPGTQMVYGRNRLLNEDYNAATKELSGLKDYELLQGAKDVRLMEDVIRASMKRLSFNEIQMRAMATHWCFASVQGGLQALTAQFGGTQLVLHRSGTETQAFYSRLARMGSGNITVVRPKGDNWENEYKEAFESVFLADNCSKCAL